MHEEHTRDTRRKGPTGIVGKILLGAMGLFFWFGDRALRDFWHFSFWNSLMAWAAVFGLFLIGGIAYAHRQDG
jgi:hypothetical protein